MKALLAKIWSLFDVPALHERIAKQDRQIEILLNRPAQREVPIGPVPSEIISVGLTSKITEKAVHDLSPILKEHWLNAIQDAGVKQENQGTVMAGMLSRNCVHVRIEIPKISTQFAIYISEEL